MATIIKKLESVVITADFGVEKNGLINRVVKCVWSEGGNALVQLVSKRTSYGGNLILPDGYAHDEAGLKKFKEDVQALLDKGELKMYGFVISVHDATDGEHEECTNVANDHVIQAFPRAWDADDAGSVLEAVKRDLRNSVAKGKIKF